MAATSSTYQSITIVALLVGSALLIVMAILYTQNQSKWSILDPATKTLSGPVSKLAIVASTTSGERINMMQVQDAVGKQQFSSFVLAPDINRRSNVIQSPQGYYSINMQTPPVQYT